jgi:hypothetical protein
MATKVTPWDSWDIAALLIDESVERREQILDALPDFKIRMFKVPEEKTPTRNTAVRTWLKDYDNNATGDVVGFLRKKKNKLLEEKKNHGFVKMLLHT